MDIDPGTIKVLLGSGITLLGVVANGTLQLLRDQLQWKKQQHLEHQKWEREKLLEIYTKCISSITAFLRSVKSSPFSPDAPFASTRTECDLELYGQAEAWLNLLLVYHPSQGTQEFSFLEKEVRELNSSPTQLRQLLATVVELAKRDTRIQTSP